MIIKIILPFRVFCETKEVTRVVAETKDGFFGILPQRVDCVAALVPGILTYETKAFGVQYVAIDEGILVKTGSLLMVSVRNAIGGLDLAKLHEMVEKEFLELDQSEKYGRLVTSKLETSFIQTLEKFRKN